MARTFTLLGAAAYLNRDGLTTMTDSQWAESMDTSPSIGEAYRRAAQPRSNGLRACSQASTYGVHSKIGGEPSRHYPTTFKRTSVDPRDKMPRSFVSARGL